MLIYGRFCLSDAPVPDFLDLTDSALVQGSSSSNDSHHISFDRHISPHSQGWNYDWVSSRHKANQTHVFRVFAVDPDTARVLDHVSSPAFLVISARHNRELSAAAAAAPTPVAVSAMPKRFKTSPPPTTIEPLQVVLRCIHERVQSEREELMAGDGATVLSADDLSAAASLALTARSESRLLHMEMLDGILARLLSRMLVWLGQGMYLHQPDFYSRLASLTDKYLVEREGTNLWALADSLMGTFKLPPRPKPLGSPFVNDHVAATAAALACMRGFVNLVDAITLDGPNDVSGLWRQSKVASPILEMQRTMLGMSFAESQFWRLTDESDIRFDVRDGTNIMVEWPCMQQPYHIDFNQINCTEVDEHFYPVSKRIEHATAFKAHQAGFIELAFFGPVLRQLRIVTKLDSKRLLGRIVMLRRDGDDWNLQLDASAILTKVG